MERLRFDNLSNLANTMHVWVKTEESTISSVLLYNEAIKLIRWLLRYDDVILGDINIENERFRGYSRGFYVTLDWNLVLNVMPLYFGEDLNMESESLSEVILYSGDIRAKAALESSCRNKFEIVFRDDENDGENQKAASDFTKMNNDGDLQNTNTDYDNYIESVDYYFSTF